VICHGNGPDHCCYIAGQVCEFLEENTVEGRRWACGLYREHGSWEKVYADPRHEPIPFRCGDWPQDDLQARIARGNSVCCWEVTDGDLGTLIHV